MCVKSHPLFLLAYNLLTGLSGLRAVIPIPGCRSPARIEENAHAAEVTLDPEDVKEIRAVVESADIVGERRPPLLTEVGDSLPLEKWGGEKA